MPKLIDLTGQKFGRLTVIKREEPLRRVNGRAYARWVCECECGKTALVTGDALRRGTQVSCGCYRNEQMSKRNKKHDKTDSRAYYVWSSMKSRCSNSNVPQYKFYGGRGIYVCDEWKNSFEAFYTWLIDNGYDESAPRGLYTIDRIEPDGPYTTENCRLVTQLEQANNLRSNRWIECDGEKHTLAQWSRITGVPSWKIRSRIDNLGWTNEKAIYTA